jgi:hypothetical protein
MSQPRAKLITRLVAVAVMASASAAASAATAQGNLAVAANVTAACEVTPGTISFGTVIALQSTPDVDATSTGFAVACSSGLSPTIKTATVRLMAGTTVPGNTMTYNLSLAPGAAADDFPSAATALVMTSDGTPQAISIYGKLVKASFQGMPQDNYTQTVVVDVGY